MQKVPEASGCCRIRVALLAAAVLAASAVVPLLGQTQGGEGTSQGSSAGGQQASGPATVQAAQQTLNGLNGSSNVSGGGQAATQNDYKGSIVEGKATAGVLDLSLDDAIQRSLRNNLGIILNQSAVRNAAGTRLQELQALLPTVTGKANYTVQQINLAAYGLSFPNFNPIVGPFQTIDFRAYLTQSLFNLQSIDHYLASKHNFEGAKLSAEDARNMVVLTVGNAYLLCIADASRITAQQAVLSSTKVSLDQAVANHDAGVSPRLDVLRAQVDYQNAQQQLIQARNGFEKDKLALARTIGLPTEQQFRLTDTIPYAESQPTTPEQAFQLALANRKDLQGMAENVKGAELQKKAASAEPYPSMDFTGDYGGLGRTLGSLHDTYTATGQVSAPVLQIAKDRGDKEIADAALQQQRARYSDQVQQVNQDVRDALLDIEATRQLVATAKSNVDLASEALLEAQQRFRAGVTDNLAVSDAQAQAQQADDQYISALYQNNMAKLSLARATGTAGTSYKQALGTGGH